MRRFTSKDPPHLGAVSSANLRKPHHGRGRLAVRMVKAAPIVGLAVTVLLSVIPGTIISKAAGLLFYSEFTPMDTPDQAHGIASASSLLMSENKVITFILFLYMPVVYLWKATGRLSKEGCKGLGEGPYILPIDELSSGLRDDPFSCMPMIRVNPDFGPGVLSMENECNTAQDMMADGDLCGTFLFNRDSCRRPLEWAAMLLVCLVPLMWGETQKSIFRKHTNYLKELVMRCFSGRWSKGQGQTKMHISLSEANLLDRDNDESQGQDCPGSSPGDRELEEVTSAAEKPQKKIAANPWRDPRHTHVLKAYNTRFTLYRRLPYKAMSRAWGRFNQLVLPRWLRTPAFRLYIWMFSCRLDEAANPNLLHYRNLSEFFRRQLRPGLRPVARQCLTSPADGRILYHGPVKGGVLEQVKGVTYCLRGFIGPLEGIIDRHPSTKRSPSNSNLTRSHTELCLNSMLGSPQYSKSDLDKSSSSADLESISVHDLGYGLMDTEGHDVQYMNDVSDKIYASRLLVHPENRLYHCIVYLAPGDYHKFHSPADWTIFHRRHFPGELFSVKPSIARWLQGLFNFNERALYTGRWRHGFFSMTAVGATNVGSINVFIDPDLVTNTGENHEPGTFFDAEFTSSKRGRQQGVQVKKGQLIGDFNLGSTIVLLFEAPAKFHFKTPPGTKVQYGQVLGDCGHKLTRVQPAQST